MIVYKYRVYMPEENEIIPRIDTTMPNSQAWESWLIHRDREKDLAGQCGERRGRKKEPSEKRPWKRVLDMQEALAEL